MFFKYWYTLDTGYLTVIAFDFLIIFLLFYTYTINKDLGQS